MSPRRIAPRWAALAALVLVLALTPFVPHGGDHEPAARPAADAPGRATATGSEVGYGRVSAAARRTIDRVAGEAYAAGRLATHDLSRSTGARALVDDVVRCAVFEGQRYCIGTGWTDRTQAQVRAATARVVAGQAAGAGSGFSTGDRASLAALRESARMAGTARADAVRRELTQAARSVAKVWLLRHEIQGVPLPAHFFARHPEVRGTSTTVSTTTTATTRLTTTSPTTSIAAPAPVVATAHKPWRDYPDRGTVLDRHDVRDQHRTYWCGPTSMQMIVWGWTGERRTQSHWADRLGTTTSGSSITDMVRVVNHATGYDNRSHAGPYIVLDIGDWSFRQWMLLMARHVVDYRAPVVLHPVLLARYYPYLDHDGSGHFQVGRGYQKRDGRTPLLGYFEPWNQQRFHPDEPFIARVQWRNAYQSYRANQAHPLHDLGV
jgi:Peptidase_C39 like family